MGGKFIPDDYMLLDNSIRNFFENTVAINFNHRWLASFTFILIIILTIYLSLNKKYSKNRLVIILIFTFACLQFFLGILTLMTNVKIILASMHQINSMLLLLSLLFSYHQLKKQRKL